MEYVLTPKFFLPMIISTARYLLFGGVAVVVFYQLFRHAFRKAQIGRKLASRKDMLREVGHSLQSLVIIGVMGGICTQTSLVHYTQFYTSIDDYSLWWFAATLLLAPLIQDTYFYWLHRFLHHPGLYRRFHLTHHKSVHPSPWAAYSFDAAEAFLESLIAPVLLFAMPMHPLALLSYITISTLGNVYGHLGFEIAPRWLRGSILFEWLATSVYHNLHHSKFRGNYGLYFRHWDRLMGTEHPGYVAEYDRIQAKRFGVTVPTVEPRTLDVGTVSAPAILTSGISATDSVVITA